MPDFHITKNYFAHGGGELVIGGRLTFLDGAEVENFPGSTGSGGTAAKAAYVADSEATSVANLKTDFNALLAALRTAGLMEASAPATAEPETPTEGTENTPADEGGGS